jgi:Fungal Zn(2)-Cys(6) binuclear cluster domain
MECSSSTSAKDNSVLRSSQTPCILCKRRKIPWKGSNLRCRPYEKSDQTCDHQSSSTFGSNCFESYTHLQENDGGLMECPNPECSLRPRAQLWKVGQYQFSMAEISKPKISPAPLILRTGCSNCRLGKFDCSGLVTGPRCGRCNLLDLECDCKILRKACAECMKDRGSVTWKRCAGFRDACDACIEKGIECKEFIRGAKNEYVGKKRPQDVLANGATDIIDGMKALRAFTACVRCSGEKLKCDESLPGCGGCVEQGVDCNYRLLTTAISGELLDSCFSQYLTTP